MYTDESLIQKSKLSAPCGAADIDERPARHVRFRSPLVSEIPYRESVDWKSEDETDEDGSELSNDQIDPSSTGSDETMAESRRRRHRRQLRASWIPLAQLGAVGVVLALSMLVLFGGGGRLYGGQRTARRPLAHLSTLEPTHHASKTSEKPSVGAAAASSGVAGGLCSRTCHVRLVESIPQNLTFASAPTSMSTFDAWLRLIDSAKHTLTIAAYKSSLRGKHVFGSTQQHFSDQGEAIFEALARAGLQRRVYVRILENSPSKDKGDNEDARHLEEMGAVTRRQLNLQRLYGTGVMHSKFLIADERHFYLGSANLDWRSLNQKMEMGVLVTDCGCLARDLSAMFELYWKLASARNTADAIVVQRDQPAVRFGAGDALHANARARPTDVFLAASPRSMNAPGRTWDLSAIVDAINTARTHLYIHVMDYFPVFIYSKDKRFWPAIDDAIRAAALRGVNVKILTAGLHYPRISMRFLQSLEALNTLPGSGGVEVKVLKVPSPPHLQSVIRRDRRTHKKFLVTDEYAVIGTSNWSGDYFEGGTTGAAFVIHQNTTGSPQTLLAEMRDSFRRDWDSAYAHPLPKYVAGCVDVLLPPTVTSCANSSANVFAATSPPALPDFCEPEKDRRLFVKAPPTALY